MSDTTVSDVRRDIERVSPDIVAQAAKYQAAILADVAGRRGTIDGVSALAPSMKLAGPAFTVEVRPGDNLMIHAAMAMAKPGDVLVIDGKGDTSCALMGALMLNGCKVLGLGGVVIDGAVRDTEELRELGFPVFARAANPNGPTKFVPGRINWPVSVGGVAVRPGDLVVGDADGVVVVEREKAASLLPLAAKKVADETKRLQDILAKRALKPGWLDASLRAAGVLKEGESL
ncbi:MAG: RraA family protein [Betaproteobacteria bacterium]|nr:RraA family protein [Betaproteobacteria bacterium]